MGLKLLPGPGGLAAALPGLLAALGERLPTDPQAPRQTQAAPIADLVLELADPAIQEHDGIRRATATASLVYRPADGSPHVESWRFRFTAPLGPIESEELAWYLERYHRWPGGVFQDRARRVEQDLPQWGRRIYDALGGEAAREALEAWKKAAADRRFTVKVDPDLPEGEAEARQRDAREAATSLVSLPWELVDDGRGYLFFGARPVRVRRQLPNRYPQAPLATAPPIRVLLVSARPEDESAAYIDHRASARPLVEALSGLGALAEFKLLSPATFPALQEELQRAFQDKRPYHVVHFDGHGVYSRKHGLGTLCFEHPADAALLERRRSAPATADKLAEVMRDYRVPLFFLDACQTAKADLDPAASVAARLLQSGVASVVAMSHSVLVETARRFVSVFYRELVSGKRVGQAMLAGQQALKTDTFRGKAFTGDLHLEDWFVPVLFQEQDDPQLFDQTLAAPAKDEIEESRRLALGDVPPPPSYSFVGRSREMLKAERVLERERYVVLRGEGGEGKTTLAAETARWLVATRRFDRAAFVSLEKQGDARSALYGLGFPNFPAQAGGDDEKARQLVARALGDQPAVLVLDNMESVLPPKQGSEAAAAFEPEVLQKVLDLCGELARIGGTRLIFTSREPMPEPFDRNEAPIWSPRSRGGDRPGGPRARGRREEPGARDAGESEEEVRKLVEAVSCHARSLVLLAGEVAQSGVASASAPPAPSTPLPASSSIPPTCPGGSTCRWPRKSAAASRSPAASKTTPTARASPKPSSAPDAATARSSTPPLAPASEPASSSTARSTTARTAPPGKADTSRSTTARKRAATAVASAASRPSPPEPPSPAAPAAAPKSWPAPPPRATLPHWVCSTRPPKCSAPGWPASSVCSTRTSS